MISVSALITPPDIFQNDQVSILLIDPTEKEDDSVTQWLHDNKGDAINLYYYKGEESIPWILHSLACATYKYINIDNMSPVSSYLAGYILSKRDVYYYTANLNISSLYSHINVNKVNSITDFLGRTISGKK